MGGKGGGQSSTTNTVAQPWSGVQPYLKSGYSDLSNLYNQGAPSYYPGQTVAQFTPQTNAALDWQTQRAISGSPVNAAAQNNTASTLNGDYLSAGNPYMQQAYNAAAAPVISSFNNQVLPGITSQFAAGGRTNSGLHQDTVNQATQALTDSLSNMAGTMAYNNYSNERSNQIKDTALAPSIANQDYYDINQLGTVGSILEGQNQANINSDINRYNYNSNADWQRAVDYLSTLAGAPGGSSSSTTQGQSGSPFTSALSGAASGAGIGALIPGVGPIVGGLGGGLLSWLFG